MTTRSPYQKKEPIAYGEPTIGPRTYLTKGPSGWPESFDRKKTDKRLVDFLNPLTVEKVIDLFLRDLKIKGAKAISWSDVSGYLGHLTSQDPDLIPEECSVSLWAQTKLYIKNQQRAEGAN